MDLLTRFFAKVNKRGRLMPGMKTRCHEWTGSKRHFGYGGFWFDGKIVTASRMAWYLKHGKWPKPHALHKCDNPACVRVDHLFEGTVSDNTQDMLRKGRARYNPRRGEDHGRAKLSDAMAATIYKRVLSGEIQAAIALDLKINQSQVSRIFNQRRRKNLPRRA